MRPLTPDDIIDELSGEIHRQYRDGGVKQFAGDIGVPYNTFLNYMAKDPKKRRAMPTPVLLRCLQQLKVSEVAFFMRLRDRLLDQEQ